MMSVKEGGVLWLQIRGEWEGKVRAGRREWVRVGRMSWMAGTGF
jgi:hypothetical protein